MPHTRLDLALDRVRRAHPFAASGYIHKCPEVLESGRRLLGPLLQLEGVALETAMSQFTLNQARLIVLAVSGQLDDVRTTRVLVELVKQHPSAVEPRLAFEAFVLAGGPSGLRACAQRWVVEAMGRVSPWPAAMAAGIPLHLMRDAYIEESKPWATSDWKRAFEHTPFPRIETQLFRSLLCPPVLRVIAQREQGAMLKEWASRCFVVSERDQWLATFLEETWPDGWARSHAILEEIHGRFGVPGQHSFWTPLAPDACRSYLRWLVDHDLTRMLGEGDRVQFWRRFMGDGMEVPIRAGGGEAVLIVFKRFVAVQFIETGKATYLVDRTQLTALRRLGSFDLYPYVLKLNRDGKTRQRYEHRGQFWQIRAEGIVRALLRET